MRHVDFAPLYRSTVGFDRLFSLLDSQTLADNGQTYPPYNIERTGENAYRVTLAVAGFGDEELSIEARENVLTVKGEKAESQESDQYETLYRGICRPRLRAPLPAGHPQEPSAFGGFAAGVVRSAGLAPSLERSKVFA